MGTGTLISKSSHALQVLVLLSALCATAVHGQKKSRLHAYTTDLFGLGSIAGVGLGAGMDQLSNQPPDWGKSSSGFGKRLASNAGSRAVFVTTRHGLAAMLDRSTDYVRCTCKDAGGRFGHGIVSAFTDLDRNGHRVFSEPLIVGTAAGAFAPLLWEPNNRRGGAAANAALTLGLSAAGNIMREFISWWP